MERLSLDPDEAFASLRRISQTDNRKLLTICNEIVETRQLPAPIAKWSQTTSICL
jgi:AmiR/NasT family two-component response regulator